MKALHVEESQTSGTRNSLADGGEVEIRGRVAQRIFSAPEVVTAGFEATEAKR